MTAKKTNGQSCREIRDPVDEEMPLDLALFTLPGRLAAPSYTFQAGMSSNVVCSGVCWALPRLGLRSPTWSTPCLA